jgi:hypothetical protein
MTYSTVAECVDGLDEPACDAPAAPQLGDIEVFQIAGRMCGPGGMQDKVRQPGQLTPCSATSPCTAQVGSHNAAQVRSLTLRGKHGPVEVRRTDHDRVGGHGPNPEEAEDMHRLIASEGVPYIDD